MMPLKHDKFYTTNYYEENKEYDKTQEEKSKETIQQPGSLAYFTHVSEDDSCIMRSYNTIKKINKFKTLLLLLVIISFILNCLTIHYMLIMKMYAEKISTYIPYIPRINNQLNEAYIRFNQDSDQLDNLSDIIQSEDFQHRYNKISEFVDIISIEDINKLNQLILNINPVEVGQLIHELCKIYECG